MFIQNKYTKWYYQIINSAKNRLEDKNEYYEDHHIIPSCIGGSDDKSNKVLLLAREHFICHLLLTKMHDSHKLKFALHLMSIENGNQKRSYKISSRLYEYIRKLNKEASSVRNKTKTYANGYKVYYSQEEDKYIRLYPGDVIPNGYSNGMAKNKDYGYGKKNKNKKYYHNPITKKVIAISENDDIPAGFIKGNPQADTSKYNSLSNSKYYHDPITGEEKRSIYPIDNWVLGRPVKWYNDGKINKQFNEITDSIPSDFKKGRISPTKGKTWKRKQA